MGNATQQRSASMHACWGCVAKPGESGEVNPWLDLLSSSAFTQTKTHALRTHYLRRTFVSGASGAKQRYVNR